MFSPMIGHFWPIFSTATLGEGCDSVNRQLAKARRNLGLDCGRSGRAEAQFRGGRIQERLGFKGERGPFLGRPDLEAVHGPDDDDIAVEGEAARDLGISGCVLKSESLVKLLPDAIQQVYAGRSYYSPESLKLLTSEESEATPLPFMTEIQRRAAAELLGGVKPTAIGTALGISRSRGYDILGELLSLFELPEGDYHNLTLKLVNFRKELMA